MREHSCTCYTRLTRLDRQWKRLERVITLRTSGAPPESSFPLKALRPNSGWTLLYVLYLKSIWRFDRQWERLQRVFTLRTSGAPPESSSPFKARRPNSGRTLPFVLYLEIYLTPNYSIDAMTIATIFQIIRIGGRSVKQTHEYFHNWRSIALSAVGHQSHKSTKTDGRSSTPLIHRHLPSSARGKRAGAGYSKGFEMDSYVHTYIRTYVRTYVHTYVRTYVHTYGRPSAEDQQHSSMPDHSGKSAIHRRWKTLKVSSIFPPQTILWRPGRLKRSPQHRSLAHGDPHVFGPQSEESMLFRFSPHQVYLEIVVGVHPLIQHAKLVKWFKYFITLLSFVKATPVKILRRKFGLGARRDKGNRARLVKFLAVAPGTCSKSWEL